MPFPNRNLPEVRELGWEELTLKEQRTFLRLGYIPPEGTILRNNLDIEAHHENPRELGDY